jgi:ribokinase
MIDTADRAPLFVVVVGSCIVDFSVEVQRLPAPGETVIAGGLERNLGGKGANQATALSRLGVAAALIACVGADDFGTAFLDFLHGEGVDTAGVTRTAAQPTGIAMPMILPGGANAIVAAPAASLALSVADVTAAAAAQRFERAAALLLSLEGPEETTAAAMAAARRAGCPVFLNPAPWVAGTAQLAAAADVLIPNQVEAAALAGQAIATPDDALRVADRLRDLGPPAVIITLGDAGAAISAPGCRRVVAALPIAAVDSTGAGDAFCAGLVAARCRGAGWTEAVEAACACGALACRGKGATAWLPTAAEVSRLLAGAGAGAADVRRTSGRT